MPRRDDIDRILVLGSGPIVIGQAAEFDYSGVQACKVLLDEGYEVVLANSNPATIMTDPEFATATYIEPLVPEAIERVIEHERHDTLLPTVCGGTALNLARNLNESRVLDLERRPDGGPHRRLGHGGAAADPHRPPVPEPARPGDRGDPGGRRRDRRLEHPVRRESADRRDRGDRDEPARLALERAGLE